MRPRATTLAAVALLLGVPGCGGDDPERKPLAPVRLTLDAPADQQTVDVDEVEVRGRVWPARARVLVAGEEADSGGGTFSAQVALDPGANVIDVVAGARGRRSAATAVRVTRIVDVTIPDLEGQVPHDAVRELRRLGLKAESEPRGDLFDDLLPGTSGVCETDPPAGARVPPGTEVAVLYAKVC
jgi:hypothetical protein